MKKILLLLLTAVLLTACDNKVPKMDKGQLDPNAMIIIKPGVKSKATIEGLTPLEIVEQTYVMTFRTHWTELAYHDDELKPQRGFADAQKDYDIPALKMWGTDIIGQNGKFQKTFLYGTDFYLIDKNYDTIGYIPQNVIDDARVLIEKAFEDENYTEVYSLFDKAFTFLPISK